MTRPEIMPRPCWSCAAPPGTTLEVDDGAEDFSVVTADVVGAVVAAVVAGVVPVVAVAVVDAGTSVVMDEEGAGAVDDGVVESKVVDRTTSHM